MFNTLMSIGSLGSRHDAYRDQVKRYKSSMAMYGKAEQQQNLGLNRAEKGMQGVISGLNKGFGMARADLSQYGNAARRGVLSNQKQGMGELTQRLQSSGLANSTVLANAQAGMASRTSRELADIDERLGAIFSSLRTSQAGAVADARTNLSNFQAQKAGTQFAGRKGYIDIYMGGAPQKPDPFAAIQSGFNADFANVMALIGGLGGAAAGGGMGGLGGMGAAMRR